jgi:hypothetical protein
MKYVAIHAKFEAKDGAIKFSFQTADGVAWALYQELAERFPLLTMEGGYSEYGFCIAGDVRCHGGKCTHADKSEEFAAKIKVWHAKEDDDRFYADLLKFVAHEPNGIRPGTIGEQKALIAKKLVAEDAGLVAPERRDELMGKISTIHHTPPHSTAAR